MDRLVLKPHSEESLGLICFPPDLHSESRASRINGADAPFLERCAHSGSSLRSSTSLTSLLSRSSASLRPWLVWVEVKSKGSARKRKFGQSGLTLSNSLEVAPDCPMTSFSSSKISPRNNHHSRSEAEGCGRSGTVLAPPRTFSEKSRPILSKGDRFAGKG